MNGLHALKYQYAKSYYYLNKYKICEKMLIVKCTRRRAFITQVLAQCTIVHRVRRLLGIIDHSNSRR